MTAPFPPLTADDYRNHPDLCKIIPPNAECERNPDRLPLAELLGRDGSNAAVAARRAEARRKADEPSLVEMWRALSPEEQKVAAVAEYFANAEKRAVKNFGKWFVGFQNDYPFVIDAPPKSNNDHPDHNANVTVIAKPFAIDGMTPTQVAHLLAAAPDLLEALKQCRNAIEGGQLIPDKRGDIYHQQFGKAFLDFVAAAITKATGSAS